MKVSGEVCFSGVFGSNGFKNDFFCKKLIENEI